MFRNTLSRFYLIIIIALCYTPISFAQQSLTCADFREGTFIIPATDLIPETIIIRKGEQQTEISTFMGERRESVIDLKWINDCTYTVALDKEIKPSHDLLMPELKEVTLTVTMIFIEGNCARFNAEGDGIASGLVYSSIICKEEIL